MNHKPLASDTKKLESALNELERAISAEKILELEKLLEKRNNEVITLCAMRDHRQCIGLAEVAVREERQRILAGIKNSRMDGSSIIKARNLFEVYNIALDKACEVITKFGK
jgi:hypothetical protein